MASDETNALLDEIEDPGVGELADLRSELLPALDAASRTAEQMERIRRRLEAADFAETDREVTRYFERLRQKLGAARREADDARDELRRAVRSLLEVQDTARYLFAEVGREPPPHLEEDQRTGSPVREPADIRQPE